MKALSRKARPTKTKPKPTGLGRQRGLANRNHGSNATKRLFIKVTSL